LSNVSSSSISTEEIVEDGRVQWSNSLVSHIIVVGVDLGALVVVRLLDHLFNNFAVFSAELVHGLVLILKLVNLSGIYKS